VRDQIRNLCEMRIPILRIVLASALLGCAAARPPTTGEPAAAAIVERQIEAYNAQDVDAFAATYADDVVITRGPDKKPFVQGKQALRETYGKMFAKYPACRARVAERKTEGDNVIVDHEIITGRGPERPDPWDAGWVRYTVANGLIKSVELP
jgi:uncharacterized protein (TIGR02246 family)